MQEKKIKEFVPSCFEGKNGKKLYEGHVKLAMMKSDDSQEMLIELGLYDNAEKIKEAKISDNARLLLDCYKFARAKGLIVGCDVTRLSDGQKIESYEELEYIPELRNLPLEIGKGYSNGFAPGNEQGPASA